MKLPRDLSGDELAQALGRLTTPEPTEHHLTIPRHAVLRVGLLSALLRDLAAPHDMGRDEWLDRLFG